jgi:hypothetical protein
VYVGTQTFGRRARGKHVRLSANGSVPQDADRGEDNLEAALVRRNAVPAIVDVELFRRVQALLTGGRRRGHHQDSQPLPLSGLGECGSCGGPLHAVYAWATQHNGKRTKVRRLICAKRHRYGTAICPDGSTGCSHDHVLGVIFQLLAETLLADGAAERLTLLAEERVGEAQRQAQTSRDALIRRLAELDASLARSQVRLVEVAGDMLEDVQAGIRRLKQQRAEAQVELEQQQEREATAAEMDPRRFRQFWERCRQAHAIFQRGPAYPPSLHPLLAELIEGFTLHFKRDAKGRSTPDWVDVELPRWLTALASNATPT